MKSIILFAPEFRKNSELAERIRSIANDLGCEFSDIYVTKNVNPLQQQHFLYAVHVADVVVVDYTIPTDFYDGGVYPALTAQVNCLNHVIGISENNLPLNITPHRGVYPRKDGTWLNTDQIIDGLQIEIKRSLNEDTYPRLPQDMHLDLIKYQSDMENMIQTCLEKRECARADKTRIMISYRNSHRTEVEEFCRIIEGIDPQSAQKRKELGLYEQYEVIALPPASLCGAEEAHTPMRRWMLVGLLEDTIRNVDEVWVYESRDEDGSIDYTNSWWTIAEMVMTANINYNRSHKISIKAYNVDTKSFYPVTPDRYLVHLSESQIKRLARLLSNTRPDTMGPECLEQVRQLKMIANLMRLSTREMKQQILENLRANLELSVPKTMDTSDREKLIDEMIAMYSNPKEIDRYVNDDVFQEKFWSQISYQTDTVTPCFLKDCNSIDGRIDVDLFMSAPMTELTPLNVNDINKACEKDGEINLGSFFNPKRYKVSKAENDRFLWLATRMGQATVKDGNAPGLERIRIYNIKG